MKLKMDKVSARFARVLRAGVLLALFAPGFLSGISCSKEEVKPTPKPIVTEEQPKQYDIPFDGVPATADIVMYEVNLWAFSQEGNLEGVTARLDELQELGVNVIWLMPIYEIGEVKGIGSPYAIKNYKKINPAFGTLENLRTLVKEAHTRDMAVMLDWVGNHTAWDNAWIQNQSWYTRDGSGNIVNPPGTNWNDVADLNFGSSAMRKEMIKAMKYWVLEANVDGFRCDYADGVPVDFWKQAIDTLRGIPDRDVIMFAEGTAKELLGAGFDLIFGWNFYSKMKDVYINNASAATLVSAHSADYANVPQGKHILRWISNHDDNAWDDTPVSIFDGQEGALAAFVVTSYMGGVPLLYNGQEVGFPMKLQFFQNSSTKIDWTLNPDVLAHYKKIIAFRRNSNAVRTGSLETFHTADVMAFRKTSGDEEVLVIANLRSGSRDFAVPAALSGKAWTNAITGAEIALSGTITLDAYQYLILKL